MKTLQRYSRLFLFHLILALTPALWLFEILKYDCVYTRFLYRLHPDIKNDPKENDL